MCVWPVYFQLECVLGLSAVEYWNEAGDVMWCVCVAVPSGVHDAAPGQAPQLHPRLPQRAAEGPPEGPRVHPPDAGAAVPLLHRPRGGAGLPIPLPLHHDRLQLLLLHLPGARGKPGAGSVSAFALSYSLSCSLCGRYCISWSFCRIANVAACGSCFPPILSGFTHWVLEDLEQF